MTSPFTMVCLSTVLFLIRKPLNDAKNRLPVRVTGSSFILINCLNIFKNEKRISEIIQAYNNILRTQGIEKIKKKITCII